MTRRRPSRCAGGPAASSCHRCPGRCSRASRMCSWPSTRWPIPDADAAKAGRPTMFVSFFFSLRQAGVPVSLTEFLTLLEALKQGVCGPSIDEFYFLSRTALVKDERHLDKFDRVFGQAFRGIEPSAD